jgi:transcriptional regulator with XRE-family HTH domain
MINNEDFTKRLEKVIEFYSETASSFAEKIGVQRSSISHILSGRNKPSLDFVLKVLSTYPEVELYWLLNGKGDFPKKAQYSTTPSHESAKPEKDLQNHLVSNQDIERIVIFFKDGTFKNFNN